MSSRHSGILFSNMTSLPTEMSIFQRVIERGSFAGAAEESEIASAGVSPHGHLRVPAFPSFAVDKLAPILPDFLARCPRITIDFLLTNRFVDVIGENVDVAFRAG